MWQGIHGHDEIVEGFCQSLRHGRLASSYLFLGTEGIGKRSFALQLAKALLCTKDSSNSLTPCEQCESCRLFRAGNHPDLDFVSLPAGKSRLPVELFIGDRDHRNQEGLCHNIALRPMLSSRRVAIIDDADHLSIESANSLLKTLEEPPPGAVLILIGTSRSRQLPTILSRTQVVRFQALEEATLLELIRSHEIVADASQAESIAHLAGGSLSKAASLSVPELWEMRQSLIPQFSPAQFSPQKLGKSVTDFVNLAGKEASEKRKRLRWVLHAASEYFRALLHLSCGLAATGGHASNQSNGSISTSGLLAVLDRCLEAETELDRNANQATLIECWLDDLATLFRREPDKSAH